MSVVFAWSNMLLMRRCRLLCSSMLTRKMVPGIRLWQMCMAVWTLVLDGPVLVLMTLVDMSVWQCRVAPSCLVTLVSVRRLLVDRLNCGAVSSCTSVVSLARLYMMRSRVRTLPTLGCLRSVVRLMMSAARLVRLSVLLQVGTRAPEWNRSVMRGWPLPVLLVSLPLAGARSVTVRPVKCMTVLTLRLNAVQLSMLSAFLGVPLTPVSGGMLILCTSESL